MTPFQYVKNLQAEKDYKEFFKYFSEGKTIAEIAKIKDRAPGRIRFKMQELNIIPTRKNINSKMDSEIPSLINAGYTIMQIADMLNVSKSSVASWINRNMKESIVKIRHDNNILIRKKHDDKYAPTKSELSEFFNTGASISDAVKKYNVAKSVIYSWLKSLDIQTKNQKSHKLMEDNVLGMIKQGLSLKDITKKLNLTKVTVSRWIKNTTGKNYTTIKNEYKAL